MKIHDERVRQQLQAIDFDTIARTTGFEHARTKKITAYALLMGFFLLYSRRLFSLEHWASCTGQVLGTSVSKQAVALKVAPRHVACFEQALKALLGQILPQTLPAKAAPLWAGFGRVLVEDSTCAALDARLAAAFPSSHNKAGRAAATARLRWVFDLKREQVLDYHVTSFRQNDQSQAGAILSVLQPGDLLLRDLGFFALRRLGQIAAQGAFFLTRLRYGVQVRLAASGQELDLVALAAASTTGRIDLEVLLGSQEQLPVRLVGVRLSETQAAARRRKAHEDRHSKARHSAHYLEWLSWSFFVTNVPATTWSSDDVVAVYRLRWRIEMWFKGLKSGLQTERVLSASMPYERARLVLYGIALFVVLVVLPCYRYFVAVLAEQGYRVSVLRFVPWLALHLTMVLAAAELGIFVAWVRQHCCYEKRRNRKNYYDLLFDSNIP